MVDAVRIGMVGCGGIARPHVRGWKSIPTKARIIAGADVDEGGRQWLRSEVSEARLHDGFEALIADPDVDAVDICLPHHLHRVAILAAAQAGKHILCEKPLCLTLAEAHEIGEAVERSGVTFMAAHNHLMWPAVQEAARIVRDGQLGAPIALRTLDCGRTPVRPGQPRAQPGWRADRARAGGGELLDTGYHPVYTMLFLAQSAPTEVTAMAGRYHLTDLPSEDTAHVLIRFADGAIGNILTTWAFRMPTGNPLFQVVCAEGEVFGRDHTIAVRQGDAAPVERTLPVVDSIAAEVAHFADCVRLGQRPLQTHIEATMALRVILAAYRSIAEGITVALPRQ